MALMVAVVACLVVPASAARVPGWAGAVTETASRLRGAASELQAEMELQTRNLQRAVVIRASKGV